MKKAILFLVLLLVVAGAAVGVLYFLKLGPFEGPPPEKTAEELELEKETTTTTIAIKPFTIPMFQGERVAGGIKVQFDLEVALGQEELINAQMIRLEDAYLRDLYVFMPRLLRNKESLDIAALKKRLKRITKKVLGEDATHVEDILIQSVADTK
ncbi:exported hypothetical protein [Candidatus Terasakiella magnetica]|uniref:Flagellar protein FliL n=1 Tax=Candidatus Terasakiella magnetica TaxID=1867952 RepID=A0A1C3RCZ8_9PROT|nr:hypothetical protein [Candidatus Terasakiella magnetica]SCA55128.1 exported hypothetical protein [Candidatus Terasakiella magnetica]